MPKRVAVLISGRGSNMMSLVRQANGYEVALVVSDKPDAPGLAWARSQGIPTFTRDARSIGKQAWEEAMDGALRAARIDAVALAGYMRLLSDRFVAAWRDRIVNIHPSLLPAYKGLDTHARAIRSGALFAGCTVHVVTEKLDAGRVIKRRGVKVGRGDTPETLAARVLDEEHRLYPAALAEWLAR